MKFLEDAVGGTVLVESFIRYEFYPTILYSLEDLEPVNTSELMPCSK